MVNRGKRIYRGLLLGRQTWDLHDCDGLMVVCGVCTLQSPQYLPVVHLLPWDTAATCICPNCQMYYEILFVYIRPNSGQWLHQSHNSVANSCQLSTCNIPDILDSKLRNLASLRNLVSLRNLTSFRHSGQFRGEYLSKKI